MPNDDAPIATTMELTWEQKAKELTLEVLRLTEALKASNDANFELARDAGAETGRLSEKIAELTKKLRAVKAAPTGDFVQFRGETFPIIGDFRADNTFAEVKKGHCDEGITLIAIPRVH